MARISMPSNTDTLHQGRKNRLLREMDHDTYKSKRKLPEPTLCPDCGAVFQKGRWIWGEPSSGAHKELCPACHRIHDRVPAGFLTITGDFVAKHKEEIMNLIHNVEEQEKAEHPLKRIMGTEEQEDGWVITFTDAHIARRVGESLYNAYKGELDFQYTEEETMLRVNWRR